jgi:hypothetical protein
VAGDLLEAVEDADPGSLGKDDQILAHGRGRDGVIVAVEADPESLGAAYRGPLSGVEAMLR